VEGVFSELRLDGVLGSLREGPGALLSDLDLVHLVVPEALLALVPVAYLLVGKRVLKLALRNPDQMTLKEDGK
jgi:hypothetical protein